MRKHRPSRNEGVAQSSKYKDFDGHAGAGWPLRGPHSGGIAGKAPGLHSKAVCWGGRVSFLGLPRQSPTNRAETTGMSSPLLLEARGPWSAGSRVAPENPERGPMPASLPAGLCQHLGQPQACAGHPLVSPSHALSPVCLSVSVSTFASVKTPAIGLAPSPSPG